MSSQQLLSSSTKQSSASSPKPAAAGGGGGGGAKPRQAGCPTKPGKAPPLPVPMAVSLTAQMDALAVSSAPSQAASSGKGGGGGAKSRQPSVPKPGNAPPLPAPMAVSLTAQMEALAVSSAPSQAASKGKGVAGSSKKKEVSATVLASPAAVQTGKPKPKQQPVQPQPKGLPRPKSGPKVSPPANSVAAMVAEKERRAMGESDNRTEISKAALETERVVTSMFSFLDETYGGVFTQRSHSYVCKSNRYKGRLDRTEHCWLNLPVVDNVHFAFYMHGSVSRVFVDVGSTHRTMIPSLDELKAVIEALVDRQSWRKYVDKHARELCLKRTGVAYPSLERKTDEESERSMLQYALHNSVVQGHDGGRLVFLIPQYEFADLQPDLDAFARALGRPDRRTASIGGVTLEWDSTYLYGPVVSITRAITRDEFTILVDGYGKDGLVDFEFRFGSNLKLFIAHFLNEDIIRLRRLLYGCGDGLDKFQYRSGNCKAELAQDCALGALARGIAPAVFRFKLDSNVSACLNRLEGILGKHDFFDDPRDIVHHVSYGWEKDVWGRCTVWYYPHNLIGYRNCHDVVEIHCNVDDLDSTPHHEFSGDGCLEFFLEHFAKGITAAASMEC